MRIKWPTAVAGLIAVVVAGPWLAWSLTYVDDAVARGAAYGFEIGQSKQEAFASVRSEYDAGPVSVMYPLNHQGYGPFRELRFSTSDREILAARDVWKLYPKKRLFDSVELQFANEQVVRIHRHYKLWDLP